MFSFEVSGDLSKTISFLEKAKSFFGSSSFDKYGKIGVEALREATPKDSGKTANSWYYEIQQGKDQVVITWLNSNINKGVPIAIILQYGHGTGTGGYVRGTDYINPAMTAVFEKIANDAWREVTGS